MAKLSEINDKIKKVQNNITIWEENIEKEKENISFENFVKNYDDVDKFNKYQLEEIYYGFRNELSLEEVELYSNPKFNADQMEQIREGFQDGLSMEQVQLYANPKLAFLDMYSFRKGLKNGEEFLKILQIISPSGKLPDEFIKDCMNSGKFNEFQIEQICYGFEKGLTMEQVSTYAKPEFNERQMQEIRAGFQHGLTREKVQVYAKPEFTAFEYMLYENLEDEEDIDSFFQDLDLLDEDVLKFVAESNQMDEIRWGFEHGLTIDQVLIYAKPEFNDKQMKQIREGFEDGLQIEQVQTYAKSEFTSQQMKEIRKDLKSVFFCRGYRAESELSDVDSKSDEENPEKKDSGDFGE